MVTPDYPFSENLNGREGWVHLGFMVDPTGKPFEIMVLDSTGNKHFEDLAIKAMKESTFEPGSLNGRPIEAGAEMTYKFINRNFKPGARPDFAASYAAFQHALMANDKSNAEAALERLKITTLYEDAYYGLATYLYAARWGDDSQQLSGLRRAVGTPAEAQYFSKGVVAEALLVWFNLDIKIRDYGGAMDLGRRLEKSGIKPSAAAQVASILEKLEMVRDSNQSYDVEGTIEDSDWHLLLFKPHFRVSVSRGSISQVKLICDKGYVAFAFDPKLQYEAHTGKYGQCILQFDGSPGTSFTLTQF